MRRVSDETPLALHRLIELRQHAVERLHQRLQFGRQGRRWERCQVERRAIAHQPLQHRDRLQRSAHRVPQQHADQRQQHAVGNQRVHRGLAYLGVDDGMRNPHLCLHGAGAIGDGIHAPAFAVDDTRGKPVDEVRLQRGRRRSGLGTRPRALHGQQLALRPDLDHQVELGRSVVVAHLAARPDQIERLLVGRQRADDAGGESLQLVVPDAGAAVLQIHHQRGQRHDPAQRDDADHHREQPALQRLHAPDSPIM